jgi:hypothetical protein
MTLEDAQHALVAVGASGEVPGGVGEAPVAVPWRALRSVREWIPRETETCLPRGAACAASLAGSLAMRRLRLEWSDVAPRLRVGL